MQLFLFMQSSQNESPLLVLLTEQLNESDFFVKTTTSILFGAGDVYVWYGNFFFRAPQFFHEWLIADYGINQFVCKM